MIEDIYVLVDWTPCVGVAARFHISPSTGGKINILNHNIPFKIKVG